jgi:hypothetical protein
MNDEPRAKRGAGSSVGEPEPLRDPSVEPVADPGQDVDPEETCEWIEALDAVLDREGPERGHYLLEAMIEHARRAGLNLPFKATTAYVNTIPTGRQKPSPGDAELEWRIRGMIRWNAAAMVVHANKGDLSLGGHIASFASAATLYDVGFNHFFRAPSKESGGDLVFIQGHSSPGIYARAYLEGRLTEEQLEYFRREISGKGLSSYPHPWLMPDFWQFPTVSMGLAPMMAIYQARFMIAGSSRPTGARCGRSWATARWTSPSRWARSRSPAGSGSTISSSSSTATCSDSTGRCAATARSSRSSRASSAARDGT